MKQVEIEWQFEFPPEVQAEREIVLMAYDRAMNERTPEAIRAAGVLGWDWVTRHPEDYAVWDAGEPIVMLAEAMGIHGSDLQASQPPRALAGTLAAR